MDLALTPEPMPFAWPAPVMTVSEVAAVVRVTPKTVRLHIRRGLLRALQHRTGDAFPAVWAEHQVGRKSGERKRLVHPELGTIEVDCQTLVAADEGQSLLVFTATPGSEAAEQLRLLGVIGRQRLGGSAISS